MVLFKNFECWAKDWGFTQSGTPSMTNNSRHSTPYALNRCVSEDNLTVMKEQIYQHFNFGGKILSLQLVFLTQM